VCFDGFGKAADPLIRAIGRAKDRADARAAMPAKCPACSSRKIIHRTDDDTLWACRNCGLMWTMPMPDPVPSPPTPAPASAACPACGSADSFDIDLDPPVRTCRACGWRGYVDADDGPTGPEDRGTPVWVWRDEDGRPSFGRPRGGAARCEVSAPIGWRLGPDPADGVALVDVFGDRLSAGEVLRRAGRGEGGFRVRGWEATG
jgi:uncharacterized protein (DUF983 family)